MKQIPHNPEPGQASWVSACGILLTPCERLTLDYGGPSTLPISRLSGPPACQQHP